MAFVKRIDTNTRVLNKRVDTAKGYFEAGTEVTVIPHVDQRDAIGGYVKITDNQGNTAEVMPSSLYPTTPIYER